MDKGIEMHLLLAIEAEMKQIMICVEGIQLFLNLAKIEGKKLEENGDKLENG